MSEEEDGVEERKDRRFLEQNKLPYVSCETDLPELTDDVGRRIKTAKSKN